MMKNNDDEIFQQLRPTQMCETCTVSSHKMCKLTFYPILMRKLTQKYSILKDVTNSLFKIAND